MWFRLPTTYYLRPTTDYRLPTTDYRLPVRHYLGDVPCLAKNNEGSMLVERSMLTMRIERSICPRGASVRLPCLSKGACLQCVSRGASVRLQCLSKGACLQCVSRGASVRLQDGCSRLFWFAEDSGLFWKGSTCHSTGLFIDLRFLIFNDSFGRKQYAATQFGR